MTVPDLARRARARSRRRSTGTFIEVGGLQINTLTATTTYENQKLDFQTHLAAARRRAARVRRPRELDATRHA